MNYAIACRDAIMRQRFVIGNVEQFNLLERACLPSLAFWDVGRAISSLEDLAFLALQLHSDFWNVGDKHRVVWSDFF